MGQLIGPIPSDWWITFKMLRESMAYSLEQGRVDAFLKEKSVFRENLERFYENADRSLKRKKRLAKVA